MGANGLRSHIAARRRKKKGIRFLTC